MDDREKRAKMMGEEKIPKILLKLAVPAIIAMLINAIYNVADTIFVGKLGTSAIGAVTVTFPIFTLIGAIGLTFGVGAGSYISRLLGEKNNIEADKTASTAFFSSMFLGVIFTIFGIIFIKPLLKAFGATDTMMIYAVDYTKVIISGSIFSVLNMTMNNMIRAEGNARYSMYALIIGAALNIVLDPIFIFLFKMGIKGAAYATILSQAISFIFLISYYIFNKSYVKVLPKRFSFSKKIYFEIMKIGIPTFIRQFLASISIGLINNAANPCGDSAVAAMGVTFRVITIGMMVLFGYSQGLQPIAAYNYGAKKYNRLFESISFSIKWTSVFCLIFTIVLMIFANPIMKIFSEDIEVIKIGAKALRVITLIFPLFGFQIVYTTLFQALGRGVEAAVLSLAKQGIFLIPLILILPHFFKLDGVIFSQMIADLLTVIVTAIFAIRITKKLKEESKNTYIEANVQINTK